MRPQVCFSQVFSALLSVSLIGGATGLYAQTPKVQFPNQPKEETPSEGAPKTRPGFRMSARKYGKTVIQKPVVADDGKKLDFAPGAISSGTLTDDQAAAVIPAELQSVAKEGAIAMASQDYEKARAAFKKMVAAVPGNELARANLGMSEYRLKNYPAAREQLNLAVKFNPRIAKNWVTLGLIYFREGNLEMAISSLTQSIAIDPKNAKAHQYLAVVVGAYGWMEAAEKELQKSIQLDPTDPDAHFNLAVLYMDKKVPAYELSWRHYNSAVELGAKPDPSMVNRIKVARLKASQSTN